MHAKLTQVGFKFCLAADDVNVVWELMATA
jgi:hypothetical protein